MTTQLDLFNQKKRNKSQVEGDLKRLIQFLATQKNPATANTIKYFTKFDDRYIRHLAEMSEGKILGTNLGYELAEAAPEERFNTWVARYRSQIEKMQNRLQKTILRRSEALT